MNALSNANPVESTPRLGFASFAFPQLKSSQRGVTVDYVHATAKEWYVFRITYGFEQQIADFLIEDGIYAYLAMGWKEERKNGKTRRVLKPLLNLVFAYVSEEEAWKYVRETPELSHLTFYYDHFKMIGDRKNPPLTVEERDMESFIRATILQDWHVMAIDPRQVVFSQDDEVRVIDGPFAGVRGRVARVSRQQRVIISIRGIDALIATAYIPSAFLEKVG